MSGRTRAALWAMRLAGACFLLAALPAMPGAVMTILSRRSVAPDLLELAVGRDCGSYLDKTYQWLVTCSESLNRVQLYSREMGFVAGWFAGEPDPFKIVPRDGGIFEVHGGRGSTPWVIDVGRVLRTDRSALPATSWSPAVLQESLSGIRARTGDLASTPFSTTKRGLASHGPSPRAGVISILIGSLLLRAARRMSPRGSN